MCGSNLSTISSYKVIHFRHSDHTVSRTFRKLGYKDKAWVSNRSLYHNTTPLPCNVVGNILCKIKQKEDRVTGDKTLCQAGGWKSMPVTQLWRERAPARRHAHLYPNSSRSRWSKGAIAILPVNIYICTLTIKSPKSGDRK